MSKQDNKELFTAEAAEVEQVSIESQVEDAYIEYAMSVIGGRALPDVRDGLKPVQRRTLYKMYDMGITNRSSHRKSSSIIGETMGDLHPHGDKAIYDSLVRMSQDFSLGVPLVDGQGNFGSMDGDPPAAMRYTEARMSPMSEDMLDNIDKETVDFVPNYDNRLEEPEVLPAALPNLLINGASGIAVGMTTDIQPHNVGEIIDATIHRMRNPDCTVLDLMDFVKGPDFPTGATVVGRQGIKNAYETGKGKIRVRANYTVYRDHNQIVVDEIPYQKRKSKLVEQLADYANDGTIKGISDIRDESDRDGVHISIDVKSTSNIDIVENKLIDNVFEKTISMNHIALVNGQPQRLNLPGLIDKYIEHRREVVQRRSEYLLNEAEERHHIVMGRLKALDDIDSVVEAIRNSDDRNHAIESLREEFEFSKAQADHITRMQLSSLTGLKQEELRDERDELEVTIEELEALLNDSKALDDQIVVELEEMKSEHNHERRTVIKEDYARVADEDLIPQKDVVIVLTDENYIKRMPVDDFEVQNRGGKGVFGLYTDDDKISQVSVVNTHDSLLLFTDTGDVHELKGYEIPEASRQAHGTNIINLLELDNGEEIQAIEPRPDEDDIDEAYITIATENGQVNRTDYAEFENIWNPGLRAIGLPEDDNIVNAYVTYGDNDVMLATTKGKVIRFDEEDVRSTGRTAYGVYGIELAPSDSVASMTVVREDDDTAFTLTENGRGKRTALSEYRVQARNGKGIKAMNKPDGDISVFTTLPTDGTLFVGSKDGKIIKIELEDVSQYGRTANGLTVMKLSDEDKVASASCID
jgi:DNA gyrase subunit A